MSNSIALNFAVRTLDGKELLPAGAELTPPVLSALSAAGAAEGWPETPLLEFESVRQDLREQMAQKAYSRIFCSGEPRRTALDLMERIVFPLPVLEGLSYFRESDFYTYRHILMVCALSCLLSHRRGDRGTALAGEVSAGPLHDMGKICVPLPVLMKRSPLFASERKLLEGHSAAGYVLLAYYLGDAEALSARVARDHHERRDSSGYPRAISLEDQQVELISVCDIYDALITPRPYRKGNFDNRSALEEITEIAASGKVSWDMVRDLVALNREGQPRAEDCVVSLEKRGVPPAENNYGTIAGE